MDGNAKQQIVERIKGATNILVTVSRNPTVDELSAALALSFVLNKLDKHATAVFSGQIPPAITFLEPKKTFESTVDSLRDFIIALNKEKADRLRYKVEDDVVRIFITPYKATITNKDLQFSQGDFNVEVIIALGVEKRDDLDTAITAHGRILHDATIITINDSGQKNDLGAIDWHDPTASSLSEMLMSLTEDLQKNIIDEQIATALLTGIVAATQRFSNTRTTPKVMTMAAQLMGAGANQQLIAARLEEAHEIPEQEKVEKDGSTSLPEGASKKLKKEEQSKSPDGEIRVAHELAEKSDTKEAAPTTPVQPEAELKPETAAPVPTIADLEAGAKAQTEKPKDQAQKQKPRPPKNKHSISPAQSASWRDQAVTQPALGGTLNATTEEAAEEKRRTEEDERNNIILSHDKPSLTETIQQQAPINAYAPGAQEFEPPTVDPFAQSPKQKAPEKKKAPSIADLEAEAHAHAPAKEEKTNDVRADIEKALNEAPFNPAHQPVESLGAQELPVVEKTAAAEPAPVMTPEPAPAPKVEVPAPASAMPGVPQAQSAAQADDLMLPPPPPLPDFSTLPPLPPLPEVPAATPVAQPPVLPPLPEITPQAPSVPAAPAPSTPSAPAAPSLPEQAPPKKSDDPSEFKIPGM